MIRRLQQVYNKFIFCLSVSTGVKTFVLLIINSKRFHRFQKQHVASGTHKNERPVQYNFEYKKRKSKLFLRTHAGDIRMFYETFLDDVYSLPDSFPVSNIIIDAGANIGMTSLYFSIRYPETTIFCIEPSASNMRLLQMNLNDAINAGRIHVLQAALFETNGEINIKDEGWAYNVSIDKNGKQAAAAITMNTFFEINKFERVDLLKIDIEGAEKFIFGANREWLPKVNAILIEMHSPSIAKDIRAVLSTQGFYFYQWSRSPTPGDVIFASRTIADNGKV